MPDELIVEIGNEEKLLEIMTSIADILNLVSDRGKQAAHAINSLKGPDKNGPSDKPMDLLVDTLESAMRPLLTLADKVKSTFDVVTKQFNDLTGTLTKFVAASNPAIVQRMQFAFADLAATIGAKVAPLLEVAVGIVEKFADALSLLNTGDTVSALSEILSKLGDVFNTVVKAVVVMANELMTLLQPALDAISETIDAVMPGVQALASALVTMFAAVKPLVDIIASVFIPILQALGNAFTFVARIMQGLSDFIYRVFHVISALLNNPFRILRGFSALFDDAERDLNQRRERMNATGGRARAAGNVSIMGLEQVSSRALEAAGRVGVIDPMSAVAENTRQAAQSLQQIASNTSPQPNLSQTQAYALPNA